MHRPGYVQGGQEASFGYLLLGVYYRRIPGSTGADQRTGENGSGPVPMMSTDNRCHLYHLRYSVRYGTGTVRYVSTNFFKCSITRYLNSGNTLFNN
jgi:hypothetical protein